MTATVQLLLVGVVHVQDVVHGGADPHWSPPKLKMPSGLKSIESIETEMPAGNGSGGIRFTSPHCPGPPSPPALPPIGREAIEIVGAFFFVGCGASGPLLSGAGVENDSDGTVPVAAELPAGAERLVDGVVLLVAVPVVALLGAAEPPGALDPSDGAGPPLDVELPGTAEPLKDAERPGPEPPFDVDWTGATEPPLEVNSPEEPGL